MDTQMGAPPSPASAGSCGGGRDPRTLPQPGSDRRVPELSVAFIRWMAAERRVRHYRLGKFIRFDPADLDAFAEVKEPLTGPGPAFVTQVWRRSRRLS
jgi:hypothetical protein